MLLNIYIQLTLSLVRGVHRETATAGCKAHQLNVAYVDSLTMYVFTFITPLNNGNYATYYITSDVRFLLTLEWYTHAWPDR